jgi:hypothetical protein
MQDIFFDDFSRFLLILPAVPETVPPGCAGSGSERILQGEGNRMRRHIPVVPPGHR